MFEIIDYLIDMRNALAHGKIIIDYAAQKNVIRYYKSKNNSEVEEILSSELFDNLDDKIQDAALSLLDCVPAAKWTLSIL